MKKATLIIFTFLFTLMMISSGIGQKRNLDRDQMRDQIVKNLKLTDEQQNKIDELRLKNQKEMIDLKADLQKREIELKELKQKGGYSRSEFMSQTNSIISAKNKIEIARAEHQMDVYELLDDAQKEIWNKKRSKLQDKSNRFRKENLRRTENFN